MADSDKITAIFNKANYQNAKDEDELLSDKNPFLIFNTCSVRQKAEDRVFGLNKKLIELKDKNPNLKVVLTGCMMHYSEKELKNFPDCFLRRSSQKTFKQKPMSARLSPFQTDVTTFAHIVLCRWQEAEKYQKRSLIF